MHRFFMTFEKIQNCKVMLKPNAGGDLQPRRGGGLQKLPQLKKGDDSKICSSEPNLKVFEPSRGFL